MPKNLKILILVILITGVAMRADAASVEQQRCKPGGTCDIGEFLYNDNYAPITSAGNCILTSRDPEGDLYLDPSSSMSTEGDGWYHSKWTVSSSQPEGIYPTQVCCTPTGEDKICIDKTFVIGPVILSGSEIENVVWDAKTSNHAGSGSFGLLLGNLLSDIWSYTTRSLTTAALNLGEHYLGEQLAIKSETEGAISSAQNTVVGAQSSNTSLVLNSLSSVQNSVINQQSANNSEIQGYITSAQNVITNGQSASTSEIRTAISSAQANIMGSSGLSLTNLSASVLGVQATADIISSKVDVLQLSTSAVSANIDNLVSKWGSYDASQIIASASEIEAGLGSSADTCASPTVFGYTQCLKDKWGIYGAVDILTSASSAAAISSALRNEINYSGKSTTAYDDLQTLKEHVDSLEGTIGTSSDPSSADTVFGWIKREADSISAKVDLLQVSTSAVNANIDNLIGKWGSYDASQIIASASEIEARLGTSSDVCSGSTTIFGYTQCIRDKWGSQSAADLFTAANNAAVTSIALRNELNYDGKSTTAYADLQTLKGYVDSLEGSIGSSSDLASVDTIFGRIRKAQDRLDVLNTSGSGLQELLDKWGTYSASDIYDKVKDLSSDISDINTVSDVSDILDITDKNSSDLTSLKNSILSLKAIVDVNRTLLDKLANTPVIQTWMEEGSIIFKTLITNPSTIATQRVPLKFYLPKEASKKDIIKIDPGLSVNYDPAVSAYYVSGQFDLGPSQTKIVSVEVTDIWKISDAEIDSLRTQTGELSEPLKNTSYFAQGVTLKSDILVKLDNIVRTQQEAYTPDARILAYRENVVQLDGAKSEINDLKSLLTQASSTGTMFGFIGGVQVFSVWGIIFILITSFVFMLLYTKLAIGKLKVGGVGQKIKVKEIYSKFLPKKKKPILITITLGLIFGFGMWFLRVYLSKAHVSSKATNVGGEQRQLVPSSEPTGSAPSEINVTTEKGVLGSASTKAIVKIPSYSDGVNVRVKPDINSQVIYRFPTDESVLKYSESGSWTEIGVDTQKNGIQYSRGWVFSQFINTSTNGTDIETKTASKKILIKIPEGVPAVNVRDKPSLSSNVITSLFTDQTVYQYSESGDWLEIGISVEKDGKNYSRGWVNKQFAEDL